jgi:hypothetical protein
MERAGPVSPSPDRDECSLAPGGLRDLGGPSCSKTVICGRAATTTLPLPTPPESPGLLRAGRYLIVGR